MVRKSRPAPASGVSRHQIYQYVLLAAAPVVLLGLYMTPNHKRIRGWEAADGRYVAGYVMTVAGALVGGTAFLCMILDQPAAPVRSGRGRSRDKEEAPE